MAFIKNPLTIVQGEQPSEAEPLLSYGDTQAPSAIQLANGDWFLSYYNHAHGLLMSDKDTKMVEDFSTATEWRVIIRAKITNLPTSGAWLAFCGTTQSSGDDKPNYPYMYISAENAFRGVGVNKNNTNEFFGVDDLTDKITLGEWAYFCGYQKDGFISYSLYDDNGTLLGVGTKPNMHLVANTTYNFEIGGLQGRSTHYAKETYFDLNNIYVEKNGQALFGNKTAKMQNMGVFRFDDISYFTRCEYIESTGTQYIDTGYIPTAQTGLLTEVKDVYVESDDFNYAGCRIVGSNRFTQGYYQGRFCYGYNGWVSDITTVFYPSNWNTAKLNYLNDRKYHANNDVYNITNTFANVGYSIHLFSQNASGEKNERSYKLRKAEITEGTEIVRDFVPCYHTATGIIGLFDTVNNKFYTNAGTGEFLKGADVN